MSKNKRRYNILKKTTQNIFLSQILNQYICLLITSYVQAEKNPNLLNLIIRTSSNENSIVLDCFCGSGTTLKSAQLNNRKWIGIDQSEHAIKVTKEKLETAEGNIFVPKPKYDFVELEENTLANNL